MHKKIRVRKDKNTILRERESRRRRGKIFGGILIALFIFLIFNNINTLSNDNELLKLLGASLAVCIALLVVMYRSYVYFGGPFSWARTRRCLHCNRVSHDTNGVNGFIAFSSMESGWEKIKGCKEPNSCDIAMNFEIKKVKVK